jgi:hypothetical protein
MILNSGFAIGAPSPLEGEGFCATAPAQRTAG